jgi:3-hydroxyisobutyrate dehydrogenase-like beta-hydroxyacid dehydrogenase
VSVPKQIGVIGFGEVGRILAADLGRAGVRVAAWDILFTDPGSAPRRALSGTEVRAAVDTADAVSGAELVISAVTAARTTEAARAAASAIESGAFFLDLNSVSPQCRREAASLLEARSARYIEAAVMAPVPPRGIATAMLLGGPHAAEFLPIARELGFAGAHIFAHEIGRASAAKMCRSVMVKGIEALLAEALLVARCYGVEESVLGSLGELLRAEDWRSLSRYMISRSVQHGARRAEEMSEVARTVEDAGIDPVMSRATAERQAWAAQFGACANEKSLEAMLDAILAHKDELRQPWR